MPSQHSLPQLLVLINFSHEHAFPSSFSVSFFRLLTPRLRSTELTGKLEVNRVFRNRKTELYDFSSDPSESQDLVGTDTEKTNLLLKALHEWQNETRAAIPFGTNPNYDPNTKKRPREDR